MSVQIFCQYVGICGAIGILVKTSHSITHPVSFEFLSVKTTFDPGVWVPCVMEGQGHLLAPPVAGSSVEQRQIEQNVCLEKITITPDIYVPHRVCSGQTTKVYRFTQNFRLHSLVCKLCQIQMNTTESF